MKTKRLLFSVIAMALVSFVARAQDSNTVVASHPLEWNICNVLNMLQQRNGDIVTDIVVAHSNDPNGTDVQVLGDYVFRISPSTLQVTDTLFLADTMPPFYLYARDPRGEGNIRANIEPDGEGNTQLRIAHFTDGDLRVDHELDVVVPLCEGEASGDIYSQFLDCQGNMIIKYYRTTNPGEYEGHIARYDVEGNLLYDAIIPGSQNYIRSMEVYKESPLEYCQWRKGGNGNLNFYVLDSTFQLKNTYIINKVIYGSVNPIIEETFDFYSSNSNSTFVVPDGDDLLVAAYYERFEQGVTPEYGVAAARYDLRTMQRKALVQFNDYPGTDATAKCFGFQKMPDGTVYLLYREMGMPPKFWMTVVKMDPNLNVEWKRYCETPDELLNANPYGTDMSITVEDEEGMINGFVCSWTQESAIHVLLTHDGIPASVKGGMEVRPYMFYPIPAQDQLHLQYSPDVHPKQIELYDLQGRLVRSQGNAFETFDLGQLPAGTYTLRVAMEDGQVFSDKVAKE